jgi:hypothetical protein
MVHAYNPSYLGGRLRRIAVQGQPYLKNKLQAKGLGRGSVVECLPSEKSRSINFLSSLVY